MTLTKRLVKGSELTYSELDGNFDHLGLAANHTYTPPGSGLSATDTQTQLRKAEFFESIADLRLWSGAIIDRTIAFVRGYYAAGDGGGGIYYWDSASSATDNGGTVILPT